MPCPLPLTRSPGSGRENEQRPDILIVDEAQHLAALWRSTDRKAVARVQPSWPISPTELKRLLLLSATPVLHHEAAFLAMLHLLDPEGYALEDLDGFRQRVAKRAEIGKLFFTFREDTPPFLLGNKIHQLKRVVPLRHSVVRVSGRAIGSREDGQRVSRVLFGAFEPTSQNRTAFTAGCCGPAVRQRPSPTKSQVVPNQRRCSAKTPLFRN